jgi:hypothetical protein
MKRLLALLAGGVGLGALWRRRARAGSAPSPAADLRAKLDRHRALEADRLDDEAGQTPVDEVQDVAAPAVEDRRADVHARARRAMDELS